jgi:hypothetical protein
MHEMEMLAQIERRLEAMYPSLKAALAFPEQSPAESQPAEPETPIPWWRHRHPVAVVGGLIAAALLFLLMALTPDGGGCPTAHGPHAVPPGTAAAQACARPAAQAHPGAPTTQHSNGSPGHPL